MRRAFLAALLSAAGVSCAPAVAKPSEPAWLTRALHRALVHYRAADGAKPLRVVYIPYPKKITVVIEFDRMVYCACGPTDHSVGGRAIRFSFDRTTHRPGDEWRYCEVRGDSPPLARCLAR